MRKVWQRFGGVLFYNIPGTKNLLGRLLFLNFIMKKSLLISCITLVLFSCSSDSKSDTSSTPAAGTENSVGVKNVNGNIPDTTNTINIGTHQPNEIRGSDSLKMDTLKKQ